MPGGSSGRPGSQRTGSVSRDGATTRSTRSRRPGERASAGRCTWSGVERWMKPAEASDGGRSAPSERAARQAGGSTRWTKSGVLRSGAGGRQRGIGVDAAGLQGRLDRLAHRTDHGDAGPPLVVPGDDVPAPAGVIGAVEHLIDGGLVGGALLAVAPVLLGQLSLPVGTGPPRLEPAQLLLR